MKQFNFVSNGFGEDQIAATIATALRNHQPSAKIICTPIVGDGHYYTAAGFNVSITHKKLPSGGFLRSFKSIVSDILNGLFLELFRSIKSIKKNNESADVIICVGDVTCLLLGAIKRKNTPVFFLPTAKSSRFMPHSKLEYALIKKRAKHVFPRDNETTEDFIKNNIPASFFGNPMMDNLIAPGNLKLTHSRHVITILPGSKNEAYQNTNFIVDLLPQLDIEYRQLPVIIALAPSIDTLQIKKQLMNKGWLCNSDDKFQHPKTKQVIILTHEFLDALTLAHVVIGLAGTANEQAHFLNKPLLTFRGFGPQASEERLKEQAKLLGQGAYFISNRSKNVIIAKLMTLLHQEARPLPKTQNAAPQIVKTIFKHLT